MIVRLVAAAMIAAAIPQLVLAQLAVGSVPVPAPAAPDTVMKADLRVPIYVKDLDHLADLVKDDPVVGPDARRLAGRRSGAIAAGVVGLGTSVLLMGLGFKQMDDEFDRSFDSPELDRPGNDGQKLLVAGLGLTLVTGIAVWAIHPKRNDLLDVINGWNRRHPGEPFEIAREVGHRGGHHH